MTNSNALKQSAKIAAVALVLAFSVNSGPSLADGHHPRGHNYTAVSGTPTTAQRNNGAIIACDYKLDARSSRH
jgi:hypothetical protein